jgi:hypothetical protein
MPRKRNHGTQTIDRKIHFYRADVGADSGGRPLPFDPAPALAAIESLPFADGPRGRYLLADDGNAVCAWSGRTVAPRSLRFCFIRRTGLPQLERAGAVSDLAIAADEGLLEPVHVVFFSDNIVGADFNFYGPRLSRLGFYLRLKSDNAVPLASFHPLLRHDIAEQLDHLTELRLFDLKIKGTYISAIRNADASLADTFLSCARVLDGNAQDIELVLRPSKEFRKNALQRLIAPLKALVRISDLRENAGRFRVSGPHDETKKVELIDLLHDHLIVQKQILRLSDRSRAIDAGSAYEAIEAAHDELGDELRVAAGLAV